MILRRLSMLLVLLGASTPAWAEDDFVAQVRHEFAGELFPMDKLAPGYERPDSPVPSLAIGDFLTDDETLQNWHFAIGDLLRRRIQYVPTVRLTMPSAYYTALDAGVDRDFYDPVLATPAHFNGLRRAMGIENILTGTVTREGDALQIEAQLVDSRKGEELANSSWRVTDETLPAALIDISSWVYDELGVELTESQRAYLEDTSTLTPEAVQAYLENYIDLNMSDLVVRQELLAELREAHPTLAMFQLYELHAKSFPTNLREARENLEISNRSREAFPGHAGVALESYRSLEVTALEDYELERRLNGLRDLVVANPNDPMIMINYANAWGEQGDIHEGISVALEIVERWPDNYRGWWTLGWLVSRHAWQVRGETLWAEVPEPNRKTFRLMSFLSDQIIDKALRMNNKNGGLWVMKLSGIGSNGGYSSKLMTTFDTAAEVAPTHEPIYATALNFSQNKWGGNAAARRHIIETAEANNPNAAWPSFMRSVHQADFEGLEGLADALKDEAQVRGILENPLFWKGLFGLIVLIVIVASNLSMRRARRAMGAGPDGTDNYNRGWNDKPVTGRELTQEEMLERVRRQNQSPNRY
ncbi:MAG: hypothetical protein QNJ23_03455 [Woeseiaceae bacterium]|nr:hypothetical protein [Woeseiaceae bacterium]